MALGPRIAELRRARGWTQSDLAKRAQMSASAVAMYETGHRMPNASALERIAQALGVSVRDITNEPLRRHTGGTGPAPADPNHEGSTEAELEPDSAEAHAEVAATAARPVTGRAQAPKPSSPKTAGRRPASSGSKRRVPQAANPSASPACHARPAEDTAALSLTREEAGIILFLRANPTCLPFIESYIRADPREREQLARAWRLIRDFQSYSGRTDGST